MLMLDIEILNKEIEHTGVYVYAQSRNGYTGLDEYEGKYSQRDSGKCIRNLKCGTPKECLIAAELFVEDKLSNV